MLTPPSSNCKNCNTQLLGPICHQCGQKAIQKRWSLPILSKQFVAQVTNIERGFLYTTKMLFKAPGKLISDYWNGRTVNYYNPFRYALILVTLTLLINLWLGIDDLLQASMEPRVVQDSFSLEQIQTADKQFNSWLNILVLLLIPFYALMTHLLFKKHGQNFAEHLIMNFFIAGQQSLISCFTQFIFYFFPSLIAGFMVFNWLVGLVYNSYVYRQTFKEAWSKTILKAFVVGVLGILVFFGLIIFASTLALLVTGG